MSPDLCESGIDTMKKIILVEKEKNQQLHGFGTGAIDRIKDHYEREKGIYEGILNSDKATKAKYDIDKIKADLARMDRIIAHAKAASDEVKK
jgi:hypothetical protein